MCNTVVAKQRSHGAYRYTRGCARRAYPQASAVCARNKSDNAPKKCFNEVLSSHKLAEVPLALTRGRVTSVGFETRTKWDMQQFSMVSNRFTQLEWPIISPKLINVVAAMEVRMP